MIEGKDMDDFTEGELRRAGLPSETSQRIARTLGCVGFVFVLLFLALSYGILGYLMLKAIFS